MFIVVYFIIILVLSEGFSYRSLKYPSGLSLRKSIRINAVPFHPLLPQGESCNCVVPSQRNSISSTIASIIVIASNLLTFKPAYASSTAIKDVPIKGWDLYGRVPYDDWLFTNEKLLDPNLLRPSIVEAIVSEMPYNNPTWARRRHINIFVGGTVLLLIGLCVAFSLATFTDIGIRWFRQDQLR